MMDYNLRDGRTYMYFKGKPLYPFGYGLSYTTFAYSNLSISAQHVGKNKDGEVAVSVDVRNTGSLDGDEVVQLYVRHVGSKVDRPLLELKGFQRVPLRAGETKTVRLPLRASALTYWDDATGNFELEKDDVELLIGSSSADLKLRKTIEVSP